jgi:UPF0042 nucleotide-binding protein
MRAACGLTEAVADYVLGFEQARAFLEQVQLFLTLTLPLYLQEGKAYLTIAVGCTGGRHRSVALVESLARRLQESGHEVSVRHRDVERV